MNLHLSAIQLVVALAIVVLVLHDKLTEAASKAVGQQASSRRRLFADYLSDARAAWSPGVAITPAWVRQVTGCSRGLSSRLAKTLTEEIAERGDQP